MRPAPALVAVLLPVLLAVLLGAVPPAHTKAPKPVACAAGRFLAASSTPLLTGVSPAIDALGVDGGGHVTLDGCGLATRATVKARRTFTLVRARWLACGTFTNVAITAKIAAPTCATATATLRAKKLKRRAVSAQRSSCGDGRLDALGDEACDASAPAGDAPCPGQCVACACTGTTTTTSTGSTTTTLAGCPGAPGFTDDIVRAITSVHATICDPAEQPIPGLATQLIGTDLAYAGTTNGSGFVSVSGSGHAFHRPVFQFGDALTFPRLAIPLTAASTTWNPLYSAALPASGADFQVGGTATSGGVSLALAAGASVLVDELTYDTADKRAFRAVSLPIARESEVIAPSGLALGVLVGTAPAGTLFCPAAAITVPNTAGYPALASVEFYIQGSDVSQQWAPFGGWSKISDGAVSADGTTISTAAGGGFPILEGVFGIRRVP